MSSKVNKNPSRYGFFESYEKRAKAKATLLSSKPGLFVESKPVVDKKTYDQKLAALFKV